ncbi:hypothetical protein BIFDEN_00482 [Bifidobacterium dentium ATCC 27678]|nr:hypothetical protein BIFDEN_00482 [Bifidobacterium dentium ATCC 27678]
MPGCLILENRTTVRCLGGSDCPDFRNQPNWIHWGIYVFDLATNGLQRELPR